MPSLSLLDRLEAALVAHVVTDRNALSPWRELRLSPECAALLNAVYEYGPDRPALVALALANVVGDVDTAIYDAAEALARAADALTVAELVTFGNLKTVVLSLHTERMQLFRKKAA